MKHLYRLFFLAVCIGLTLPMTAEAQNAQVTKSIQNDTSPPLRRMSRTAAANKFDRAPYAIPNKLYKFGSPRTGLPGGNNGADAVRQTLQGTLAPEVGVNFEGSSDDDNAAVLGFRVVPPDTDGDVGPNHYFQWINSILEIYDKDGNTLVGPVAGNTVFSGFGGICEATNNGDPIVIYDELADRWNISQFALDFDNNTYSMCVAVSTTPDPTGTYNRYEFSFANDFPDYPKLGVWGDSYTMTTRHFRDAAAFVGVFASAMDRTAMLNGDPATIVTFFITAAGDGHLPADADNAVSGPAIFGGHGSDNDNTFELWELDVDWSNPGAATFSSIPGVGIAPFTEAAFSSVVDQPNGQLLDALGGFTMHRMNVRDFGTHVSMVANHTVITDPGVHGVRWYEFRNTGSGWTNYQEGTYSPDSDDRWMGSISINASGDIALGYSRSSTAMFPSIYVTGQTADQSGSGVMNVAETEIFSGSGSQTGASRWGDYSMMSVDPVDGSFWYTAEYYAETNSFDFKTRIANFVLDGDEPTNNPPVASFTSTTSDLMADFTDTSTDSDGTIVSWAWDFGDGNTSTDQNPSNTYAAAGTYSVSLTVTDDDGDTDTATEDVTVTDGGNVPPVAAFTFTTSDLTASFTDASTDADGTIVSWDWDFGDGNTSTAQNPSNVYGAPGTYSVSLTVTDDAGDSDTATENVTVTDGSGGPTLSVSEIRLNRVRANGANRFGRAFVAVVDENGDPFVGATVYGEFSGPIEESLSADTERRGRAILVSTETFRAPQFRDLEFCVSDIVAPGYTYDPSLNGDPSYDCGGGSSIASEANEGRDVFEIEDVPVSYTLGQNYPNPFNPTTLINYTMPETGQVTIKVYNMLGQEMSTLVDGIQSAGEHTVSFDATDLPAGVYLYVMQSGSFSQTNRMTLLK